MPNTVINQVSIQTPSGSPIVADIGADASNVTLNGSGIDTLLQDFTGATSTAAGATGLVPAPTAGDDGKFLKGDGTWGTVEGTLQNIIDSPTSGNVGGTVENATKTIENYYFEPTSQTITITPNEATGDFSHAEGIETSASGIASHTEGWHVTANGLASHAEGNNTTASGRTAHAEGGATEASGEDSHAEGYSTEASGSNSHAEGGLTIASGSNSHAEGYATEASNDDSHAEGYYTTASSDYAHAEGYYTKADGDASHSEGYQTTASGYYTHSEGYNTLASYDSAHAEGYETTSSGGYGSHTEGYQTEASGSSSHAEGESTKADGYSSHAEGYYTSAGQDYQHVSGTYNDNKTNTLFEIGNGTSTARSNAFEVYQNGDINFTGSIKKNGTALDLSDLTNTTGFMTTAVKGVANGVAELDTNGKVPSSQLPSYVDDVIEVADYASLPATGETGKIYITLDDNKTYRWGGSAYVEISASLALGETDATAYRGDRGKAAYDHAAESGKISAAVAEGFYKIAGTSEGHIGSMTTVSKSDITALGIPAQDTTYTATDGSVGSASAWDAGSITSVAVNNSVLEITLGATPSLTITPTTVVTSVTANT